MRFILRLTLHRLLVSRFYDESFPCQSFHVDCHACLSRRLRLRLVAELA